MDSKDVSIKNIVSSINSRKHVRTLVVNSPTCQKKPEKKVRENAGLDGGRRKQLEEKEDNQKKTNIDQKG